MIQSGLFEERPIFPIAFMLHERKFQKLHEDFCTCLSEMLPSAFQGQPINICMDGESEVAFSRSIPDTVEEVARSLLVVHVPQQQIFSVSNPAGVVHCVKLFPKESCTCLVGTICCHILAAKYSIGMIGNQERRINLAQLRRNSRKRNDKKSGRKTPRKGDITFTEAADSAKVMISGERQMVRQKDVRWPCGVCSKGDPCFHVCETQPNLQFLENETAM